jgi:outer membrane immunogenic protein
MMKTLILASTAMILAAPAFAADLAPRAVEPAAPAYIAPAAFSWTGFYVGANAGYGFSGKFEGTPADGGDGFTVGGQAGYNYQFNPIVVGIEGEIDYADIKDRFDGFKGDLNWRGSVTPRLGFAIDRFMPYIKGGFAFGDVEFSDPAGNDDQVLTGWTVGGGAEYAVTDNVTVRAEYNYTDLGKDSYTTPVVGTFKAGYKGSDVKLGVNYKF